MDLRRGTDPGQRVRGPHRRNPAHGYGFAVATGESATWPKTAGGALAGAGVLLAPGSQPPNTAKLDGLAGFTCAQGLGTTPRRGMDVRDRHDAGARYHRVGLGGRPPLAASVPGRLRAGTVLITRGKFSIVIAALGAILADGAELGAMAAAYVLLTAMAGPVAAKYADRLGAAVSRRVSPDRGHLSR